MSLTVSYIPTTSELFFAGIKLRTTTPFLLITKPYIFPTKHRGENQAVEVFENHTISDPDGFLGYLLYNRRRPEPSESGDLSVHINREIVTELRCFAPDSMGFPGPQTKFPLGS